MNNYFKLIRPYGLLFLGLTPVFGAICNGEFKLWNLFILLIIGCLMHIFTFIQNDYYDLSIDKKSKYVDTRPLASGQIAKMNVLIIIIIAFCLAIVLYLVFLFTLASFFCLFLTFLLITLYNKYSKKVFFMEYVLGTGVFTFGLFGAFTVSATISLLAIITSLIGFFQWIFSVGISANLKDVEYDTKLGIKTTPVLFDVKIVNNKMVKPLVFKIYAFGLKIIHIISTSLPFVLLFTSITVYNQPVPLVCFIIISISMLYTTYKILSTPIQMRDTLLRFEGVHEGIASLLIPIVLMEYLITNIGMFVTLLILLAILVWPLLTLRLLFGKKMIPLE
jgi:4-hydroxybenzoate polyprenyltransferase